ncbi:hypothetical protein CANARDRAFT_179458, partial [[Candida] arabinofermentans NRRL YB-2248]
DVISIKNASKIINDKLLSKGYFSTNPKKLKKLLLLSLDADILLNDKIRDDFEVCDKVYENDKNIINAIYALLDTVEISTVFKESTLKKIHQQEMEIERLKLENESKQKEIAVKDKTLHSLKLETFKKDIEINDLRKMVNGTKKMVHDRDRKFENYVGEVYRDMRKFEIEIDRLEGKLKNTSGNKRRRIQDSEGDIEEKENTYNGSKSLKADNERYLALLDKNSALQREGEVLYGMCLKVYNALNNLNGGKNISNVTSFIPTVDELLKMDIHLINLNKLDNLFMNLVKQGMSNDSSIMEDTFKFKRNDILNEKQKEIQSLKANLQSLEIDYKKVLNTMEQWKTFKNKK